MKTLLATSLAMALAASASGQIFRPDAGRGAPRGGHHDRGPARVVHSGHSSHYRHPGAYVYRHAPRVWFDYRPAYYPAYSYYPAYGVDYPYYGSLGYYGTPSAASSGFWLGALAGGIIGHNSGEFRHNGWRGAAWGAGVGWLLGSIADANRRVVSYPSTPAVAAPAVVAPAPVAAAASAPAAAPQSVTIINHYYQAASPMSGANGLFGR